MSTAPAILRRPARRAGVIRRALRREAGRIREPRRLAAMLILAVLFAIVLAGMVVRGDTAGADAQAYWAAVRIWLEGGDPYHPLGPFLPYVYAPWMLPLFVPWALLPWEVAWFAWRGGTILLLLWSIRWAYTRRPLPTAILVALLFIPTGANLDTGNINLLLALALFGAQFTSGRVGGLIWGLATWMKWVPAVLWLVLPARARGWGLVFLALSGLLSLVMLPLTIIQLQVLFGFGERPFRADYLVFIWSIVPWWWQLADPFAFLRPTWWVGAVRRQRTRARRFLAAFRTDPRGTTVLTRARIWAWGGRFLGLVEASPSHGAPGTQRPAPVAAEIVD
ncbi:MAG TPA: glycosyltransferase family 87 protein [Candidatus Limnocylindrales bacterium]